MSGLRVQLIPRRWLRRVQERLGYARSVELVAGLARVLGRPLRLRGAPGPVPAETRENGFGGSTRIDDRRLTRPEVRGVSRV